MAKEILAIPESKLSEVITVIREGLRHTHLMPGVQVSDETRDMLFKWCDEEER